MMRVYADVCCDLFHSGHVEFLKTARDLGDYLIVGVLSAEAVQTYKRSPIMSAKERAAVISCCRYVDETIVDATLPVDRGFMLKHDIDIVVHAHHPDEDELYNKHYLYPISTGQFVRLDYSAGITTTEIISRILHRDDL